MTVIRSMKHGVTLLILMVNVKSGYSSEIFDDLETKLNHVPLDKRVPLIELLLKYKSVFPDPNNRANVLMRVVDVGNARMIKQHPYRVKPIKLEKLRQDVQYMLDKDIIEPSQSSWASPCVLVRKPDGSIRYCTDYRKVNVLSKTDLFPIPRMEDCIDQISYAKYITKCDLLKGYWCEPPSELTKEISAFATPDGLYQYKVMFKQANLTVNLSKSDFVKAKVIYLGHVVGHGVVTPINGKSQKHH